MLFALLASVSIIFQPYIMHSSHVVKVVNKDFNFFNMDKGSGSGLGVVENWM